MVAAAESALAVAGVETPRLDAELLLADIIGVSRGELIAGLALDPDAAQQQRFSTAIERRRNREPVAYITGRKGFRRIELKSDRRALVPRPETELLVAVALVDRPCSLLDVATGSGAVALALADELPEATVLAVDISNDALDLARENAELLGTGDRVSFAHSDLLDGVDGRFDTIVANLPYIESATIDDLQPEIAHEPRLALDGGADGLDLVRRLAAEAPPHLNRGGMLALEVGDDQGDSTAKILRESGFSEVAIHQDLSDRDRVVSGRIER